MPTIPKKSLQLIFTCFSQDFCYLQCSLRWDFVKRKLFRKWGINIHAALWRFHKIWWLFKPIRNSVETKEIQWQSDISVHAAKVLFWNSLVCKMLTKQYLPKSCTCTVQMKVWFPVNPVCHALPALIFPKDVFAHLSVLHHCTVHSK